jgi:general secretion pathway protein L
VDRSAMVRMFLAWWAAQLASLLPAVLRRRGPDASRFSSIALLSPLDARPVEIEVTAAAPGRPIPTQRLVLADGGIARLRAVLAQAPRAALRLRVPSGLLLEREVVLPLAAERAPEQVLTYEMERLTPFAAADAFWSCRVMRRDRALGRLHLLLTLAPRAALAPLLDVLAQAGAVPSLVEAPPKPGQTEWRRITLGAASRRSSPTRHIGLALCGALAAAAIAVPFVRQSFALATTESQIAALAPPVAEATALRRGMAAEAEGGDVLQAARLRLGDPLQALAALTTALPDDTWLTDLTLRQRKLTMGGQSAAAVRLIARLSADPAIRNPAFTAPVTRSESGGTDQFSIAAELAP